MKYVLKNKVKLFAVTVIDALGALWPKKNTSRRGDPKSILIVRLDHLGDVLGATPVPKILKEHFPQSRILFLTAQWAAPLLQDNPFIDEILIYNPPWFARGRAHGDSPTSFWKLVQTLRLKKIDAALGLRGDFRENILMWLAKIPERVGYGITGGGFLLTREVLYKKGRHQSEHTKALLQAIGIHAQNFEPKLYFSAEESAALDVKLKAWGWDCNAKYAGIQLESGAAPKDWPQERSRVFLAQWPTRFPSFRLVLVGGAAGPQSVAAPPGSLDLRGKTTLRELCLLLKRLQVFVGPDSGPTHIASSLGVRTFFLYSGINDLEEWKPLAEQARVLRRSVECPQCVRGQYRLPGHSCMDFRSEEVFTVLEKELGPS